MSIFGASGALDQFSPMALYPLSKELKKKRAKERIEVGVVQEKE